MGFKALSSSEKERALELACDYVHDYYGYERRQLIWFCTDIWSGGLSELQFRDDVGNQDRFSFRFFSDRVEFVRRTMEIVVAKSKSFEDRYSAVFARLTEDEKAAIRRENVWHYESEESRHSKLDDISDSIEYAQELFNKCMRILHGAIIEMDDFYEQNQGKSGLPVDYKAAEILSKCNEVAGFFAWCDSDESYSAACALKDQATRLAHEFNGYSYTSEESRFLDAVGSVCVLVGEKPRDNSNAYLSSEMYCDSDGHWHHRFRGGLPCDPAALEKLRSDLTVEKAM